MCGLDTVIKVEENMYRCVVCGKFMAGTYLFVANSKLQKEVDERTEEQALKNQAEWDAKHGKGPK